MTLNRELFDLLSCIEGCASGAKISELPRRTGLTDEVVQASLEILGRAGFIDGFGVTPVGMKALSPFQAKRAIFLAAGLGSRMLPITINTPKPLVKVNGVRIIDRLLDAVIAAGIEEIYIVRGYLAEVFDQLLHKYPQIEFIDNPVYHKGNNISSAFYARDFLTNAYVFESDLLLYNPALITKYQYGSNYLGVPVNRSDDWCLLSAGDRVTAMQVGGENCHQMICVSYWDKHDGERLRQHIEEIYRQPKYRNIFWDQVPLECFYDQYNVSVRECSFADIVEIDTVQDLILLDPAYGMIKSYA